MTLVVTREEKSNPLMVFISVNKGQFLCHSNNCSISVKFDSGKVLRFRCSDPSIGIPSALYIREEKRFMDLLSRSERMTIEAMFYHDGPRQFKFLIPPLEWK